MFAMLGFSDLPNIEHRLPTESMGFVVQIFAQLSSYRLMTNLASNLDLSCTHTRETVRNPYLCIRNIT